MRNHILKPPKHKHNVHPRTKDNNRVSHPTPISPLRSPKHPSHHLHPSLHPIYHNLTISNTPTLSAPNCSARLGLIISAAPVVFELLPDEPFGFFLRASRTGSVRATKSRGCAPASRAAACGCAAGAGDASARVAKRRVDTAANFIVLMWCCDEKRQLRVEYSFIFRRWISDEVVW
jgi:hypothetical protein